VQVLTTIVNYLIHFLKLKCSINLMFTTDTLKSGIVFLCFISWFRISLLGILNAETISNGACNLKKQTGVLL